MKKVLKIVFSVLVLLFALLYISPYDYVIPGRKGLYKEEQIKEPVH